MTRCGDSVKKVPPKISYENRVKVDGSLTRGKAMLNFVNR